MKPEEQNSPPQFDKLLSKPTLMVAAFVLLLQLPMVIMPISPPHAIRQADTAAIARNYTIDSPGFFYPKVDYNQGTSGITGMEFPIYQYLAGLFYHFTPHHHDWPGKLISLLSGIGIALLMMRLLAPLGFSGPIVFAALYSMPAMIFYTAKFMPEPLGLFSSLFGLYNYRRYRSEPANFKLGGLALAGLLLGSLIRPYFIFLNLPLLIDFFSALIQKRKIEVGPLVMGLLILAPFSAWYFYWSPHLVKTFGLDYFFTGTPLEENLALLLTLSFWKTLAWRIFEDYLNWIMVPLFFYGIYQVRKLNIWREGDSVQKALVFTPLLTIAGLVLLTGRHFSPHFYYFYPAIPGFALFNALALSSLNRFLEEKPPLLQKLLPLFLIVAAAGGASQNYKKSKLYAKYQPIQEQLEEIDRQKTLFIVEMVEGNAFSLHPMRLRGWSLPRKTLETDHRLLQAKKSEGAAYVVVLQGEQMALYPIDEWIEKVKIPASR